MKNHLQLPSIESLPRNALLLAGSITLVHFGALPAHANHLNDRPGHNFNGRHHNFQQARNVQLRLNAINDVSANHRLALDLDLSSTSSNITLGAELFANHASVSILKNGQEKTFAPGSAVTAAEYVAFKQVLSNLGQSLVIDGDGRATSGSVDLDAITSRHDRIKAENLVVPSAVTVSGDFSKHGEFRLSGDLINSGSVYAVGRSGALRADDIFNNEGALIAAAGKSADLSLRADNKLVNFGTIESSGTLSLFAGQSISNSKGGTIRADRDLFLDAPNVSNAGTLESTAGNINIDATTAALLVSNAGGTIRAAEGSITIRNQNYSEAFDSIVTGGDLISQTLNLNSGAGNMDVNVEQLTGELNQTGTAAHVTASTDQLTLGKICLTGDPTYFNTAGSIAINGDITVGEALTIIAKTNITSANSITITAGNAGGGFPITLIAGANITSTVGGANQGALGPIPPANPNNGQVTINAAAASTTGGNIVLGTNVTIDATATDLLGPDDGADVTLVAYSISAATGVIDITGTTILSGGRGITSSNGNVLIMAGAPTSNAIQTGNIDTTGGGTSGGDVTILAVQPSGVAGTVFQANGSGPLNPFSTKGALVAGATVAIKGNIIAGDVIVNSDGLLQTNGNITADNNVSLLSQNGAIELFGNVTSSTGDFKSQLNTRTNNTSLVKVDNLSIVATKGSIEGFVAGNPVRFNLDANTLKAKAAFTGQRVFVQDSDSVSIAIGDSESFSNNLDVLAVGDITIAGGTGQVTAPALLTVRSSGGQLILSQDLKAQTLNLRSKLDMTNSGNFLITLITQGSLTSDTGTVGTSGQRINITGGEVAIFGSLGGFINGVSGLRFGNGFGDIFCNGTLDVISDGLVNCDSGLKMFLNNFNVNSSTDIDLPAFITGNNISLHATNDISNGGLGTGDITCVQLTLTADNGDIAAVSGSGEFRSSASVLDVHATAGDALIFNGVDVAVSAGSTAGDDLSIRVAGNISTSGTGTINAATSLINGFSINLSNDWISTISASLNFANNAASTSGAKLIAPSINIQSTNGKLGVDANSRFLIDADSLNLLSTGAATGAFVSDVDDLIVTANFKGGVDISSGGKMDVNGVTSLGGDVNLTVGVGKLTVLAGSTITSDKNIALAVSDISKTAKKTSVIEFGAGSQVLAIAKSAGLGNVLISVGAPGVPTNPFVVGKKPPKNVQAIVQNGGQIFFGKKKFTAKLAPDNVLTADGANVTFNNFLKKKAIVLDGGVIITADPPVQSLTTVLNAAESTVVKLHSSSAKNAGSEYEITSSVGPNIFNSAAVANTINAVPNMNFATFPNSGETSTRCANSLVPLGSDDSVTISSDSTVDAAIVRSAQEISVQQERFSHLILSESEIDAEPIPGIRLDIARGAAVIVISNGKTLSIYDIHDSHKGAVKVHVRGTPVWLSPGRHISVTTGNATEFADVNQVANITHKFVSSAEVGDHRVYHSEFSIPAAIETIKPLKQLMTSRNVDERKRAQSIAKTLAIKLMLDNKEPYRPHVKQFLGKI